MTNAEFDRQDHEVLGLIDARKKGELIPMSEGCIHETISLTDREFQDAPISEDPKSKAPLDWQALAYRVCQFVAAPLSVSALLFWGMLRGSVEESFAIPICWICSLISVFSAGIIIARARK